MKFKVYIEFEMKCKLEVEYSIAFFFAGNTIYNVSYRNNTDIQVIIDNFS